jgi:RimJ/RimL family protein N-acetyltransferase
MIRPYTPDDIHQVLGILEVLRGNTAYRKINPDWPEIVNVITNASMKRAGLVLVAEHEARITGVMIAVAETLWWQNPQTGARIASDLIFFSQRLGDGRRMLAAMIEWAFGVPRVVRVECGISSGINAERLERLYTSVGMVKEGTQFVINHPKYYAALGGV